MTQPTTTDRLWKDFRALVRQVFPYLDFVGAFQYIVRATDGTTCDVEALPVDPPGVSAPFDQISSVPIQPGTIGEHATPQIGSMCVVVFLNYDPAKPRIIGGDWNNAPTAIVIEGGSNGAARVGDDINPGYIVIDSMSKYNSYFPGTTAGASAAAAAAAALSPPGTVVNMDGRITSGSSVVKVGP